MCSMDIIYIVFYDFVEDDTETQRGPTAGGGSAEIPVQFYYVPEPMSSLHYPAITLTHHQRFWEA